MGSSAQVQTHQTHYRKDQSDCFSFEGKKLRQNIDLRRSYSSQSQPKGITQL